MNAARRNTSLQSSHSSSAMAAVSPLPGALNTSGMCSIEKSIDKQYVTDGTHEVTPNNEQEGKSDFR